MSILKKKEAVEEIQAPTELKDRLFIVQMGLLDNTISRLARYNDLTAAVYDHGVEHLFEVMSHLDPIDIMKTCKGIMKGITREVCGEFIALHRQQQLAVEGKGVDGIELTLSEFISDYTGNDYIDDVPIAVLKEQALHEIFKALQTAYLVAEQAQFGDQDGYKLEGLPFYYYQAGDEDGPWVNVLTFEEACTVIEGERARYQEAQAEKRKAKISELKNISFK